jgi:hypothetical protein
MGFQRHSVINCRNSWVETLVHQVMVAGLTRRIAR